MNPVNWAILGPGEISGYFARALPHSRAGRLVAVGSRDLGHAERFAAANAAPHAGSYAEVLRRDDVDAVYIGTVHSTHPELAVAALRAGKAVLCEKPLALTAAEAAEVIGVAQSVQRPMVEAYKQSFSPLSRQVRRLIATGGAGRIRELTANFGFAAAHRRGRLFDPSLGGGAILDVGGYPVSLAVRLAQAAGLAVGTCEVREVEARLDESGVEGSSAVTVVWEGFTLRAQISITTALSSQALLVGVDDAGGPVELRWPDVWGSRELSPSQVTLATTSGARMLHSLAVNPLAAEADAVAVLLEAAGTQSPQFDWQASQATAAILERWRTLALATGGTSAVGAP